MRTREKKPNKRSWSSNNSRQVSRSQRLCRLASTWFMWMRAHSTNGKFHLGCGCARIHRLCTCPVIEECRSLWLVPLVNRWGLCIIRSFTEATMHKLLVHSQLNSCTRWEVKPQCIWTTIKCITRTVSKISSQIEWSRNLYRHIVVL